MPFPAIACPERSVVRWKSWLLRYAVFRRGDFKNLGGPGILGALANLRWASECAANGGSGKGIEEWLPDLEGGKDASNTVVAFDPCDDDTGSSGSTKVLSDAIVDCDCFELSSCWDPMNKIRVAAGGMLCFTADLRAGDGEVARNIISSAASLFSMSPP